MDSPTAELALAALDVSMHASSGPIARLQRAVDVCDRIDVPLSHQALYEAARAAVDAAPDQWPRHAETLNACLRALRDPAQGTPWSERKDLQ